MRVVVRSGNVQLPIGQSPTFVTTGAGAVWVLTTTVVDNNEPGDAGTLVRVDSSSRAVVAAIPLTGAPAQVAVDATTAWVTLFRASAVAKVDLATNKVVATIPLRLPEPACSNPCAGATDFLPVDIALGAGAVWVSTGRGYVARIDPRSDSVAATMKTEFDQTGSLAVGATGVFVSQGNQAIARIDPATNAVTEVANPVDPGHGFASRGSVDRVFSSAQHPELGLWATAWLNGRESAGAIGIDPDSGGAITANLSPGLFVRAVTDRVWVQDGETVSVLSIDESGRLVAPHLAIPSHATVAFDGSAAWWTTPNSHELIRTEIGGDQVETSIEIVA